jgi:uncharacterized protein YkwD
MLLVAFAAWAALSRLSKTAPTTTTTASTIAAQALSPPDLRRAAQLIVANTNALRKEYRLPPVEVHARLAATAHDFANYLARTDTYSHTADGRTPAQRAQEHGYKYCLVLENIAYVYRSAGFRIAELAESLVEGWQESPDHRQNMLDPAVTEIGVAVAHSSKTGHYYGVQVFGRSRSLSFAFTIENQSAIPVAYTVGERTYEIPPRSGRRHEECLPTQLTILLPGESAPSHHTFRPHDGDHFVITGPAGRWKVEKK